MATVDAMTAATYELTVRDHMTLQLAGARFRYTAIQATRAYDELGYTETRFWQRVHWLLDQPAAEQAYPALVRRLRRLHADRRRRRSSRVLSS